MNNARRKSIAEAQALIEQASSIIEDVLEGEREAYENMPEGLQASEKGERACSAIEYLEQTYGYLVEARDLCDSAAE